MANHFCAVVCERLLTSFSSALTIAWVHKMVSCYFTEMSQVH